MFNKTATRNITMLGFLDQNRKNVVETIDVCFWRPMWKEIEINKNGVLYFAQTLKIHGASKSSFVLYLINTASKLLFKIDIEDSIKYYNATKWGKSIFE